MKTLRCCVVAALLVTSVLRAESAAGSPETFEELALRADAVAVARVGALSREAAALWVVRALKGRLRSNCDIVWVPSKELPQADAGAALWLLCLSRGLDGSWHVMTGGRPENAVRLDRPDADAAANLAKLLGPGTSAARVPADAELELWVKKAAKGSEHARRDAIDNLVAASDAARPKLAAAAESSDKELAGTARKLLPLTGGGPVVNDLRLVLRPATVALQESGRAILGVDYANLSRRDITLVTGTTRWGENVLASASYELRPLGPETPDGDAKPAGPALPTSLSKSYGVEPGSAAPIPRAAVVPALDVKSVGVEIKLERAKEGDKDELRLRFPHGYIAIPGPGRYSLSVRFACPGPQSGQGRLLAANYWGGGQLVSNPVTVIVK